MRLADELTAPRKVLASCRVGEQSVVSDAHQSGRQDVEQKAAEKLLHVEGHEPFRVASCAVVPAKGHACNLPDYSERLFHFAVRDGIRDVA